MLIRKAIFAHLGRFREAQLSDLGSFVTLVGRNGSGKSFLLEGLLKVFEEFQTIGGGSSWQAEDYFWHRRNTKVPIRTEVTVELTQPEFDSLSEGSDDLASELGKAGDPSTTHLQISRSLHFQQGWQTELIQWGNLKLVEDDQDMTGAVLAEAKRRRKPVGNWRMELFSPGATQDNITGERLVIDEEHNIAYTSNSELDHLAQEGLLKTSIDFAGQEFRAWASARGLSLNERPPNPNEAQSVYEAFAKVSAPPQTVLGTTLPPLLQKAFILLPAARDAAYSPSVRAALIQPPVLQGLQELAQSGQPVDDERLEWIRSRLEEFIQKDFDIQQPNVLIRDRGLRLPIPYIGGGEQNVLAILWHFLATSPVVGIEEPENHLHPELARRIMSFLKRESAERQVILATHSPLFIDKSEIANNFVVRRETATSSTVQRIEDRPALKLVLAELGSLPSDIYMNDVVLFVEGGTERQSVLPIWASKLGIDFSNNIGVIAIGGDSNLEHYLRVWLTVAQQAPVEYRVVLDASSGPLRDRLVQELDVEPERFRIWSKEAIEDFYPLKHVVGGLQDIFGIQTDEKTLRGDRLDHKLKQLLEGEGKIVTGWKLLIGEYVAKKMESREVEKLKEVSDVLREIGRLAGQ